MSLNLWFGNYRHAGIGDYIHAMSLIPEWQLRNPGKRVTVAITPDRHDCIIDQWPGVDYIWTTVCPAGFDDVWTSLPWRKSRYSVWGLDWDHKRLYYPIRPMEREYADIVWGKGFRICLQWNGVGDMKHYPRMNEIFRHLSGISPNIIVLDMFDRCPHIGRRVVGQQDLRLTMAIAATADFFVGHDSGPFYGAIGNLVPSVGLFACEDPEDIFMPVDEPDIRVLFSQLNLPRIPVSDVIDACDQILKTLRKS